MKRFFLLSVLVLSSGNLANAQEGVWSLDACMRYAVENSPKTKQQALVNINNKYDQQSAVASLFPSIGGSVGLQTNFGRSIDPETNTYSNSSNLSNGYELSATLPLFDSGQLINKLKVSKIARTSDASSIVRATASTAPAT